MTKSWYTNSKMVLGRSNNLDGIFVILSYSPKWGQDSEILLYTLHSTICVLHMPMQLFERVKSVFSMLMLIQKNST